MRYRSYPERELSSAEFLIERRLQLAVGFLSLFILFVPTYAQQSGEPIIVRPGAPGQETRVLPSTTRAVLPQLSAKDVEFMQGMIMHHAQAVEMVALMGSRTENRELLLLGARIRQSQSDEISFMTRWLRTRGEPAAMPMAEMAGTNSHGSHAGSMMTMPGMLSARQMSELAKAKGKDFDRLFLFGMIQHHEGALVMVRDLFDTAGSGQDAELFNFASDVDSGQRAEIKIMQAMLGKKN
ncbi:MAG: DUF305 domain-containing protein [Pyrinomonadaceae bacterium]